MHNGFKVSVLRYQPNYLVIYDQKYDWPSRSEKQRANEVNLSRGAYNGFMSPKTKSKVRKYLSTWVTAVDELTRSPQRNSTKKKPYLTFVTLTLPAEQNHTDNEIKRQLLIPFIQTLQRKADVWNYFWRAEAQKNGNIHFHLIVDSFIDHVKLRGYWNRQLEKLNYISTFKAKHGHDNPNSTDIHSLRAVKNAAAYLIKYVSKEQGYRPIQGRIHGCSDRVRVLSPYEMEIDDNCNKVIKAVLKAPDSKVIEGDTYQVIIYSSRFQNTTEFKKLESQVKTYHIDIGIDLYNNREASSAEIFEAERIKDIEDSEQIFIQSELRFGNVQDASFYYADDF